ncbi:hypothetical protein MP228_001939 [Amoeboaphelidium protococcarum]|nr:hypothetical protein MP228_001939 [Amoeboaphelidium protococcarum]
MLGPNFQSGNTQVTSDGGSVRQQNLGLQNKEQSVMEFDKVVSHIGRKLIQDSIQLPIQQSGSVSGNDSRAYSSPYSALVTLSMEPLPSFLLSQIESVESKCFMGQFPELGRVWTSIDNKLYIYTVPSSHGQRLGSAVSGGNRFVQQQRQDFFVYEGLSDLVLFVELVKVDKNVQQNLVVDASTLEYLLVVGTRSFVEILGVNASNPEGLTLFDLGLKCALGDLVMLCCRALEGRIILGCRDGDLYQLHYAMEEGWFRRKCYLANISQTTISWFLPSFVQLKKNDAVVDLVVDTQRSLVYSLSANGNVCSYLSLNGKFEKVSSVNVRNDVSALSNGLIKDNIEVVNIQCIAPVRYSSGVELCLLAVISNGVRVYYQCSGDGNKRAELKAAHLRSLPAMDEEMSLTSYDTAFYNNGSFLLSGANINGNALFFSTLDVGAVVQRRGFVEAANFSPTSDRIWSFASLYNANSKRVENGLNDLCAQVCTTSEAYQILSNEGMYTAIKKRPIDFLIELLKSCNGQETEDLRRFIDSFSEEQYHAMLIAIAADNVIVYSSDSVAGSMKMFSNQLKSCAQSLFFKRAYQNKLQFESRFDGAFQQQTLQQQGQQQQYSPFNNGGGIMAGVGADIQPYFSVAYHSLVLYFSRISRCAWFAQLSEFNKLKQSGELTVLYQNIAGLLQFVKQIQGSGSVTDAQELALIKSFADVVDTFSQGIQCLSIVIPPKADGLWKKLNGDRPGDFAKQEIGGLLTTSKGQSQMREMIQALINQMIVKNSNVAPVCEELSSKCPKFFKNSDNKLFKARELLQNIPLRRGDPSKLIDDAFQLLHQSVGSIGIGQLESYVLSFKQYGAPELGLQLLLGCAKAFDPDDLLTRYQRQIYAGNPVEFPVAVKHRLSCYEMALDLVRDFISMAKSQSQQSLDVVLQSSPIISSVMNTQDDLYFMERFYDQMVAEGMLVYFVKMPQCLQLVQYLEKRQYEKAEFGLYLSLYYRSQKQYVQSVQKLYEYATSELYPADLEKRIEMLTLAISIAESKMAEGFNEQFVSELQDLLDVANVQWELLKAVTGSVDLQTLNNLNLRIFSITELFNMAQELNLDQVKLSIIATSGHQDMDMILSIWQSILNQQPRIEDKYSVMVFLCQKFRNNEVVLPLKHLLPLFESEAAKMDAPDFWVPDILSAAGYSQKDIVCAYNELFESKPAPFSDSRAQMFLLEKLLQLISVWIKSPDELDIFVLQELLGSYKVFLTSHQDTDLSLMLSNIEKDLSKYN